MKGTAFPTAPTNTYVALFTANPTNAGGGTEVTGGSYARVAVASSGWSALTGTSPTAISNSAQITFPAATASWGTIIGWGLYDASTAGNLLFWNTTTSLAVASGQQPYIAASGLTIDVGN